MEFEDVRSDLPALRSLYGLLRSKGSNVQGEGSEILDEKSKLLLKKLLDGAAEQAFQHHSMIVGEQPSISAQAKISQKALKLQRQSDVELENGQCSNEYKAHPIASARQQKKLKISRTKSDKDQKECSVYHRADSTRRDPAKKSRSFTEANDNCRRDHGRCNQKEAELKVIEESDVGKKKMRRRKIHEIGRNGSIAKPLSDLSSSLISIDLGKNSNDRPLIVKPPQDFPRSTPINVGSDSGSFRFCKKHGDRPRDSISKEVAEAIQHIDELIPTVDALSMRGGEKVPSPTSDPKGKPHRMLRQMDGPTESVRVRQQEKLSVALISKKTRMKIENDKKTTKQREMTWTSKIEPATPTKIEKHQSNRKMVVNHLVPRLAGQIMEPNEGRDQIASHSPKRVLVKNQLPSQLGNADHIPSQSTSTSKPVMWTSTLVTPQKMKNVTQIDDPTKTTDQIRDQITEITVARNQLPSKITPSNHTPSQTRAKDAAKESMARIQEHRKMAATEQGMRPPSSMVSIKKESTTQSRPRTVEILRKKNPFHSQAKKHNQPHQSNKSGPIRSTEQTQKHLHCRLKPELTQESSPTYTSSSRTSYSSSNSTSCSSSTEDDNRVPRRILSHSASPALRRRGQIKRGNSTATRLMHKRQNLNKSQYQRPIRRDRNVISSPLRSMGPSTSISKSKDRNRSRKTNKPGRFRRLKNKLVIIFHHHHIHGHVNHDDTNEKLPDCNHYHHPHRSFWEFLRDIFHRTSNADHGERAARARIKPHTQRQHRYFGALLEALWRHVGHSKKPEMAATQRNRLGKTVSRLRVKRKVHWWQKSRRNRGAKLTNGKKPCLIPGSQRGYKKSQRQIS